MKKILLPVLVLLSVYSYGQALIPLDTVNNACHIDKIGFAKDNMTYTLNGDSSINIFIVGAASYSNTHYSRFRDPAGSPFANRTALTNWLDLYFFANALVDSTSAGGGFVKSVSASFTNGSAISITGSPVTDSGSFNFTFTGASNQLIAGDGTFVNANSLTLGETSTTAYRGDRGKIAYDHSQLTSGTNPHNTTFANIASKPTTLIGYGIADAYPLSGNPSGFLTSVPAQTFSSLTGKPTTLSGYGITDTLIVQGGNTLGYELVIGTKDAFVINYKVNNSIVARLSSTGLLSSAGIANFTSGNNSSFLSATTGGTISRNVADANTVVKINNINASSTGLITDFQKAGVSVASVGNTGIITAPQFNISALNTAPATATSTGTAGEIRVTSGFIYVCIAANTWVRATMATW